MKHSEQRPLFDELFTGQELAEFREASLRQGLMVLHRTRRRRIVVRGAAFLILPVLVLSLVVFGRLQDRSGHDPSVAAPPIASAPKQPRPSSIEFISDEELLALFPNEPLALVGREGQQQVVFLNRSVAN